MLTIEKTVLPSPAQWEIIIEGMRNPMNSWDMSDSYSTHIEDPEFLVMIKGGFVPTVLFFNGEYWYCNFDEPYEVTHWMPLPQPPKGD